MAVIPEPFDAIVTHAHDTRVVVIGGGIAGLIAALECAKVGMPVTVLEAGSGFGGTVAEAEVAGLRVDVGATCWSAAPPVRDLADELGLGDLVVTPRTEQTWIAGLAKGAAAPVPRESVLGIPANPWDDGVRRFIGWNGAWRAYLDRLRPPLTIGKERNLDTLVRSRMGEAVVSRLVAPLTFGRFGIAPHEVDVTVAAPGLASALTRTGSLGGAVADLRVGRSPGATVESLRGGMPRLIDALRERLDGLGAELVSGAHVTAIARGADGRWTVELENPDAMPDAAAVEPADIVFVATDQSAAVRLLSPHADGHLEGMADAAPLREIVTLVVDEPALDAGPRGAEVYAVPGSSRASGLVHQTARWEWLSRTAGPGRHVVSVAFDGPADARATAGLDDADVATLARAEASALLGVEIGAAAVKGAHRSEFPLARPASALGHAADAEAVRASIAVQPGLAAVGAWLSGSGLTRVVADAQAEADRVRRSVLWRDADGS
ncbi:protoporphyrinogen/coproporphyrinogen oxidase [Microbacterium sp. CFBP9034]|uniref:protoporphyrinogen/coproporphyrinogen oxidase n=1 Tax=Microbacterium sp. CFBP9034 TaxID=3096540 RepID=UPI002A6ADDBB|nr:FAD-dependent oxidoreductase [Microbacterium sp. CFBP9034]MDY0908320.1 FAD-dependent oxidoreductase [Microbacterium sp. CFBP9034]